MMPVHSRGLCCQSRFRTITPHGNSSGGGGDGGEGHERSVRRAIMMVMKLRLSSSTRRHQRQMSLVTHLTTAATSASSVIKTCVPGAVCGFQRLHPTCRQLAAPPLLAVLVAVSTRAYRRRPGCAACTRVSSKIVRCRCVSISSVMRAYQL